MNGKKDIGSMERRDFMKKTGLGIGVAGAAAVSLSKTSSAAPSVGDAPGKAGYRETDHVKRVYETARF